jgi:hypothetical protein
MVYPWNSFFMTAAEAAAALIGLLFVAVSVGSGLSAQRIEQGTKAFLTPTLVHFGSVIFISMTSIVPWHSDRPAAITIAVIGLVGVIYQLIVGGFRRSIFSSQLKLEDWFLYGGLPLLAFLGVVSGAAAIIDKASCGPYVVAASVLALLFSGIYGAWDMTIWIVKNRNS